MAEDLQAHLDDFDSLLESDEDLQEVFNNSLKGEYADLKVEIAKTVLDAFLNYADEDTQKDILSAFRYMFMDFTILSFYESTSHIELRLHLFSYVNGVHDPFLPYSTAKNIVEDIIEKMFRDKKGKKVNTFITFQING